MLIVSASNVSTTRNRSQSIEIAYKTKQQFIENGIISEVIALRDFNISFCNMCQQCANTSICIQNDQFNEFYKVWHLHQQVIFICPQYAAIPAKLVAIIEKMQEISYLNFCLGKDISSHKNIMIIAHGGMTENFTNYYKSNIITPLSNMLISLGYEILNSNIKNELCFGVKRYLKEKDELGICTKKENDEENANSIIKIAVDAMITCIYSVTL